jgi:hypothetical protein
MGTHACNPQYEGMTNPLPSVTSAQSQIDTACRGGARVVATHILAPNWRELIRNHCLGFTRAAQIITHLPFISFCRKRNFELPNNPQDMGYAPVNFLRFTRSGILVY